MTWCAATYTRMFCHKWTWLLLQRNSSSKMCDADWSLGSSRTTNISQFFLHNQHVIFCGMAAVGAGLLCCLLFISLRSCACFVVGCVCVCVCVCVCRLMYLTWVLTCDDNDYDTLLFAIVSSVHLCVNRLGLLCVNVRVALEGLISVSMCVCSSCVYCRCDCVVSE